MKQKYLQYTDKHPDTCTRSYTSTYTHGLTLIHMFTGMYIYTYIHAPRLITNTYTNTNAGYTTKRHTHSPMV